MYKKLCAKRRKLKFDIGFDPFIKLLQRDCCYCGSPPSTIQKNPRGNGDFVYNGLDRVNNDLGYTVDNVVPCCNVCNRAKGAMGIGEFSSWVEQAYNHMKGLSNG